MSCRHPHLEAGIHGGFESVFQAADTIVDIVSKVRLDVLDCQLQRIEPLIEATEPLLHGIEPLLQPGLEIFKERSGFVTHEQPEQNNEK